MTAKKPPELHKESGAPPKYRGRFHNDLGFKLTVLGCNDAEIAEVFEIAESTLYEWKKKYPKLSEAIARGKQPTNSEVANSLRQRALGYEWWEEVPTKVKRVEFGENGKKVREYEEIVVTKVKRVVPPDTNACSLFLRNRAKTKWQDKVNLEHSGGISLGEDIKAARTRDKNMRTKYESASERDIHAP